jgi:two-component system sensor histidine kinase UhpB
MVGYSQAELLGKTIWELTHQEDIDENRRLFDHLMLEGVPFKLEKRLIRRDGSVIWVDVSVSPIVDAAGRPQSAVTVEVDITARKKAEEDLQQLNMQLESRVQKRTATIQAMNQTLREEIAERRRIEAALRASEAAARENEEKLHTLFDLLPVGISFLDPQGKVLQTNSALLDIVKLSKDELFHQSYKSRKYIRPDGTPMPLTEFASARALRENRTIYNVETGILLEDGQVVWTSVSAAPVDVADVGVVVVTVDITENKRAEQALQESHKRLQILSQRLVEVQEEERRALARELHDRVGQTLAALNINLIIISGQLSAEAASQIGPRLNDSMKLVSETIALVRDVMTDLRPAVLDDYGLEAALESHISEFKSRYNIRVVVEKPDLPIPRLGPSVEMTFLRIVQEALMNIARHAQASEVHLSMRREADAVCISVEDNGIGIDSWQRANRPGSHGLTIMRERAEAFGGTLKVSSVPGKGTRVEVSIPLAEAGPGEVRSEKTYD